MSLPEQYSLATVSGPARRQAVRRGLKNLARPEGFEPPTYGSGGRNEHCPPMSAAVRQRPKIRRSGRFPGPRTSAEVRHFPLRWLQFGYSSAGAQERVELGRCLTPHRGQDVAVGVQCHRDLGVAQSLLNDLGMNSLKQQQRRSCMSQIMEPDSGQSRVLEERQERAPDEIGLSHRASLRITEHEAVRMLFVPMRKVYPSS